MKELRRTPLLCFSTNVKLFRLFSLPIILFIVGFFLHPSSLPLFPQLFKPCSIIWFRIYSCDVICVKHHLSFEVPTPPFASAKAFDFKFSRKESQRGKRINGKMAAVFFCFISKMVKL